MDDFQTRATGNTSALAAFLDEIRRTWRPLDQPGRDDLRRTVLDALYRFRVQRQPAMPEPEECPWDVSGLVDAPREQLLQLLKVARFNEAQLRDQRDRILSGSKAQERDIGAALARCGALISRTRKTVPMDALRVAVYGEEA
jgi:hypothetical protein